MYTNFCCMRIFSEPNIMRYVGTQAHGIRLPILKKGDNLPEIVVDYILNSLDSMNYNLEENDVVGVTEAIVAKTQNNFAKLDDIAIDIKEKFPDGEVGVVFPILSRNRFSNILRAISKGVNKVYLLLDYPSDEVGNPIMDINTLDDIESKLPSLISAADFRKITGSYKNPFTNIDYISFYQDIAPNIEIYLSRNPREILNLTKNILVADIHTRNRTKNRLLKAGAKTVYTLSDVLSKSVNNSGYNEKYGLLGSNLSTSDTLKLFPRDTDTFIKKTQNLFLEKKGISPQILIYGDGAFKDPATGIWELADPVVSPAYTEKLANRPNEIKLKYVADNILGNTENKEEEIKKLIQEKHIENKFNDGTTPRKYVDLLGSLCDLITGSGDKGTPVVYIKGYFDDYSIN